MIPSPAENQESSADPGLGDAQSLLDAVTDRAVVKLNPLGEVVHWSAGAQAVLGYSAAEVLGRSASMFHTDEDRDAGTAERELAAARESGSYEFDGWRVRKGGCRFSAGVTISAIRDSTGALTGLVEVIRDLAVDQQRVDSMFYDLLEAAPDAMIIVGPDGLIRFANAQTDRMFGHPREDLIGSEVEVLLPPRFRGMHARHRGGFLAEPELRQMGRDLDLWGVRRDGTEFPVDISLSPLRIDYCEYVSAAIRDVTERRAREEQLRKAQEELERLSRTDLLTGLVNHGEMTARLEAAIRDRRFSGEHLGVLFCDADHFKVINDTWGHPVGDFVLSTVAERIRGCVRADDTVGRIGGDEMLVLLPDVHSIDEVVAIAEKIRHCVSQPIDHFGRRIQVTMSIGATLAAPDESVSAMTARADSAMYKSKRAGRNVVTTI